MNKLIVRSGVIGNQNMWNLILKDLVDNGFRLISYNGAAATTVPSTTLTSFVVEATEAVDPLSAPGEGQQRWRIAMKGTAISTQLFCASPEQISDMGVIAKTSTVVVGGTSTANYAGQIGARCSNGAAGSATSIFEMYFWHRGIGGGSSQSSTFYSGTMAYPTVPGGAIQTSIDSLILSDPEATPFTYHIALSDHGLAVHIQVEGRDSDGCRAAWFVIQRAINSDGTVVVEGKAPLFCMFTVNGGGSSDNETEVRPATASPGSYQIMRYTVRESDVNVPTLPVVAHVHSADSNAVINPYQMVPFSEDNHFDFRLPAGFNTQRYSYPYEMDMIGYASADVISNGSEIDVQVYGEEEGGEPKKRTYKALTANSPNNTGMRIFLLKGYAEPNGG